MPQLLLIFLASLLLSEPLFAQNRVSTPEIKPLEQRSYGPIQVSMSSGTSGASITYRIKRSGQATTTLSYNGPFTLSESATLEAFATKAGMEDSYVSSRDYAILQEVAPWGSLETIAIPADPSSIVAATTYITGMLVLDVYGKVQSYGIDFSSEQQPPSGLTEVIAIASGYDYSLALLADGSVRGWGSNSHGQLDIPNQLSDVVSLCAGYEAPLALKADGTVVAWGDRTGYQSVAPPAGLTDIVALSSFADVALGVRRDGSVVAWGNRNSRLYQVPEGLSDVVAVHVARTHCMALRSNGTVVAWGDLENQVGPALAKWKGITAISSGYDISFGLKSDGTLEFWPKNDHASVNPGPGLDRVVAIDTLHYSGVALRTSAKDTLPLAIDTDASRGVVRKSVQKDVFKPGERLQLTAFPKSGYGFVGWTGDISSTANPLNLKISSSTRIEARFLPVLKAPTIHVSDSTGGQPVTVTLKQDNPQGTIRYTLDGSQPDAQSPEYKGPIAIGTRAYLRAAVFAQGYAKSLEAAHRVEVARVISLETSGVPDAPVPSQAHAAVALAGGYIHSLALLPDGSVLIWDIYGSATIDMPPAVAIDVGWENNIALHADGSISAWNIARPLEVPASAQPAIGIAAGEAHFLALTADGRVHSWGGWGDGMTYVPAELRNVVSIAAGRDHSVALRADGTVAEWNATSQLSVPPGLVDVIAIDAGAGYSVALTREGNVHYWNEYGYHALISETKSVAAISARRSHTLMLHVDGRVTSHSHVFGVPLPMPDDLGPVAAIAAGGFHSLLIYGDSLRKPAHLTTPALAGLDARPRVTLKVPLGKPYKLLRSRDLASWSPANGSDLLELGSGEAMDVEVVPSPDSHSWFLKLVAP